MILLYSGYVYTTMKKRLDFRIEEYELEIVEEYCKTVGRTKSDVIRELVRGLKRKIKTDGA